MGRGRRDHNKEANFKYILYLSGGILLILVVTFIITFVSYNNKLKNSASESLVALDQITGIVPNEEGESSSATQANSEIGKTINEVINSIENQTDDNDSSVVDDTNIINPNTVATNTQPEKPKDPEFSRPLEGEVIRGYAKDNLVFSDTLQEWIVHLGIDIKAERATVVKAAEKGTILAIKNDPRYGLTVIIEHTNGFKSVYSNLLTTEFVTEGEKVEKGQSIGTVGNSAAFEIVDPPHLHFEILKDDVNLDPDLYLK